MSARFRSFIAEATNLSSQDVNCMVLGGHGDTMVPVSRLATVGGVPLFSLLSKEEITAIEDRTRFGGGDYSGELRLFFPHGRYMVG